MLKFVSSFGYSEIPNFYGVVKNLHLFCLDGSLYSRPYSGYLFSNRSKIYGDSEDSDSTPTTAITVRIKSFIFYNWHSNWEDEIMMCGWFSTCYSSVLHDYQFTQRSSKKFNQHVVISYEYKSMFGCNEFWGIWNCFHYSWSKTGGAYGRAVVWMISLMIRDSILVILWFKKNEWWIRKVKTHFTCFHNSFFVTQWQVCNIVEIVAPLWDPRQGHVYIKSSAPTTFSFSLPFLFLLSPFSFSH